VPIKWFGFLAASTEEQRRDVRILGDGDGLWWEGLDEGVSVPGLLGLGEMATNREVSDPQRVARSPAAEDDVDPGEDELDL